MKAYQNRQDIISGLAKADPGNAGWQRDLSVSYNKVGDVQVAQGNLPEALNAYQASLAIIDRLAKSDPGNAGWQRDLSVSLRKSATCLWRKAICPRRSKLTAKPRHYRPPREDRSRQCRMAARSIGVLYKVGDVLEAQGNLPEALKYYRDSLAIFDRLAKADPGNAGWQRNLSVSYNKVGDVLEAQGNLPEALKAYRDSLAIIDRLAKADPGNAGWQRDLSMSYNDVGGVFEAQGNLPEALKAYQRQPRDCRPPRQDRSRQCRMAARSVGVLYQGRRRA